MPNIPIKKGNRLRKAAAGAHGSNCSLHLFIIYRFCYYFLRLQTELKDRKIWVL